jgi:hypothetical protein
MEFRKADAAFAQSFLRVVDSNDLNGLKKVMSGADPYVTVSMAGTQRPLLFSIIKLREPTPQQELMADIVFRAMLRPLKDDPEKFSTLLDRLHDEAGMSTFYPLQRYLIKKEKALMRTTYDTQTLASELEETPKAPGAEPEA